MTDETLPEAMELHARDTDPAPPEPLEVEGDPVAPLQSRIPRLLHIVWVGPHVPPTEMITSWVKMHEPPTAYNWFFKLWRDADVAQDLTENKDKIAYWAARRQWNGAADIIRYEILHKFGGFCVDADSECIKALDSGPIDFLSNTQAVACYEHETERPGIIGCGFLGAPKGHPFFKACMDDVAAQTSMGDQAWKAVGPALMQRVAAAMPDALKVYPAKMFNPVHFSGKKAPGDHPIYANQGWGSTKGYNSLRRQPCWCPVCAQTALRPSWG